MTIADQSYRRANDRMEQLENRHGEFKFVEKEWTHSRTEYRQLVDRFENNTLRDAGLWITDRGGNVLLVREEETEGWHEPSGKVQASETFERAAVRNAYDQTNVRAESTDLLEVHLIENRPMDAAEPPVYGVIAIFLGTRISGNTRPRDPVVSVNWFDASPKRVLYKEVRTRPYPSNR